MAVGGINAVVLGLSPTGLYVARELGNMGANLLGVDREHGCAGWSRHFRNGAGTWREREAGELLERLLEYSAKQSSVPVLFPTSDYYIEFVVSNFDVLSNKFRIFDCYESAAAKLLDKSMFQALCDQHSVEAPRTWNISRIEDFANIVSEVTYPCLLKPAMIHRVKQLMPGKKSFVANNRDELTTLLAGFPESSGGWLLQEIITGQESEIELVAGYIGADESVSEVFTARKLRQYPPGFGSASLAISEVCEESERAAMGLLHAIGFRGIFGAEFKRDSVTGKLMIIEINPRPTLWFALANASGKRIVETAISEIAGLPARCSVEQRNGVVWRYMLKDLASAIYYRRSKALSVLPAPNVSGAFGKKSRCWAVFDLRDPMPVFAELFVYAKKGLGRFL